MERVFADIGIGAIALAVLCIIKIIFNLKEEKNSFIEDARVYSAARAFSKGMADEDVKEELLKCVDFDAEDAEEIIDLSKQYRYKSDVGYSAFIKAVNKVLGKNVYQTTGSKINLYMAKEPGIH